MSKHTFLTSLGGFLLLSHVARLVMKDFLRIISSVIFKQWQWGLNLYCEIVPMDNAIYLGILN